MRGVHTTCASSLILTHVNLCQPIRELEASRSAGAAAWDLLSSTADSTWDQEAFIFRELDRETRNQDGWQEGVSTMIIVKPQPSFFQAILTQKQAASELPQNASHDHANFYPGPCFRVFRNQKCQICSIKLFQMVFGIDKCVYEIERAPCWKLNYHYRNFGLV